MSEEVTTVPVVTETPNPEVPVEAPKETPKTPEFMSEKFHALAKKEKAIVKERQAMAQQRAQFEQEKAQSSKDLSEFKRWQALKDNAKLDPDAYLQEAGLSYGALTERQLNGGLDPKAILEKTNQTIAQFKKEQEERDQKNKDEQKSQAQKDYDAKISQFVEGIHSYVDQNAESYPTIKNAGTQNDVFQLIERAAQRGKLLNVKEATDMVENYYDGVIDKVLESPKWIKKLSEKLKPQEDVNTPRPGAPTLSNNMTSSTQPKTGMITEQQRIQNALAALNKSIGE